jgi:hypothetical protein
MNNMAAARKLRYTFPPCGPCSAARVTKKGATISGRQTCVLGSPSFTNLALENSSWRARTGRCPSTLASLPEADCAAICERAEIHNRPMRECNSEALPALRSVTPRTVCLFRGAPVSEGCPTHAATARSCLPYSRRLRQHKIVELGLALPKPNLQGETFSRPSWFLTSHPDKRRVDGLRTNEYGWCIAKTLQPD